MINFSQWLESTEKTISKPYYRVVNKALYGGSAQEKVGNILAPGTYWTPRWDSVIMMLWTTLTNYKPSYNNEDFRTTVYQLNKAIMTNPPKEHKWAFKYGVDAGEQILVRPLEPPFVATDPKTGIKFDNLHPMLDPEFMEVVTKTQIDVPTDWASHGTEAILDNKEKVYIGCNYDNAEIGIYKQDGWEFIKLYSIKSLAAWNKFRIRLKIVEPDSLGTDALDWFLYDMDDDARKGKLKARNWLNQERNEI